MCLTRSWKGDCCFSACRLRRATEMLSKKGAESKASLSCWKPCGQKIYPVSHSLPVTALPKHWLISTLCRWNTLYWTCENERLNQSLLKQQGRDKSFHFSSSYQQLQVSCWSSQLLCSIYWDTLQLITVNLLFLFAQRCERIDLNCSLAGRRLVLGLFWDCSGRQAYNSALASSPSSATRAHICLSLCSSCLLCNIQFSLLDKKKSENEEGGRCCWCTKLCCNPLPHENGVSQAADSSLLMVFRQPTGLPERA